MIMPAVEQLDQLSRPELLTLIKQLWTVVEQQQERIAVLEAELKQLRQPPANSTNSSQPPSRDQKTNAPQHKKRRKYGPPFGHPKYERPLVENPDRIIQIPVTECTNCLANLTRVAPENFTRRQITELPVIKPLVLETRQHQTVCPHCLTLNHAPLPAGLEGDRYFGPQLEATVVYYKQTQHLSYERIAETLWERYGLRLSEGALAAILQRAGDQAQPLAETIKAQVITGEVIRSDETSARVQGRNWWHWVFLSEHGVYHTIVPTRSAAEITTVLGELAVHAWVSDCYGAQLTAPAEVFQLCLAHQLRDLQRVLDASPTMVWAAAVQALLRDAIHLRNRFLAGELTLPGFWRRVVETENQLDELLAQPVWNAAAQQLQKRFLTHRDKLLTFLHYPAVPPTNNESEQALRSSVVHRKVTNGFRSEWGAKTYAALQTILATAKQKGEAVFQTLVNLMGIPILPYLEASSP